MPGDADLELGLRALGGDTYAVELRFVSPGGEAEAQLLGPPPPRVYLDLAALPAPGPGVDPAACGAALSERLFADPRLRQGLAVARAAAAGAGVPLQVRLRLDAGAARLHALAWETLPGGLLYALIGGLAFGGYACLSHAAQRLVLWHAGSLPLEAVGFLDYAAGRAFLRRAGGGYLFVHRLLQEHFAALGDGTEPLGPSLRE